MEKTKGVTMQEEVTENSLFFGIFGSETLAKLKADLTTKTFFYCMFTVRV